MTLLEVLDGLRERGLLDRVQVLSVTDGKATLQLAPPLSSAGPEAEPDERAMIDQERELFLRTQYGASRGYVPGADG